ncbi:MAG: virulence RhuM family protein [Candidatus Thiodiazotropha sp. (ex Lucinoma kastoroae)]|nr:virulence RhuM family protein [Candidatus Thiodiazotropha sp. (ex Lucinoma kastoroae)]MCU7859603.1 virulence RhuM family protein [Candidatus Thiodiazotropha sp. (ex Lucinoma kastoroae)]
MTEKQRGQLILYETDDGFARIECRLQGETLWLTLNQMSELFGRDKSVISKHLRSIYEEGELTREATVAKYATVQIEGSREVKRKIEYYNLEAIFAVGYRVRSARGIQFRHWATAQLKEFLTKGFLMDDERLKNPDSSVYFDQLLERIRDIRSSEKVFWRKVCDIYATSIDYDGKAETSQAFFAEIQNKMHWAAHGHTAAEIIHQRADSGKHHMGLSNIAGKEPRKSEISIAKNYLKEDELNILNRIVTAYLEFAELQAERGRLMKMVDWNTKLNDFLKLGDHDLLTHAGKISAEQAKEKAEIEYDRYRKVIDVQPTQVDRDLEAVIGTLTKKGNENDGR